MQPMSLQRIFHVRVQSQRYSVVVVALMPSLVSRDAENQQTPLPEQAGAHGRRHLTGIPLLARHSSPLVLIAISSSLQCAFGFFHKMRHGLRRCSSTRPLLALQMHLASFWGGNISVCLLFPEFVPDGIGAAACFRAASAGAAAAPGGCCGPAAAKFDQTAAGSAVLAADRRHR